MVLTGEPRLRALTPAVAARIRQIRRDVDPARLRQHVERLDEPRSRRHAVAGMARAERIVAAELDRAGWRVDRRPFRVAGTDGVNLLASLPTSGHRPTYVVGAHLDTVPGSPGADDNASGVACLLELARVVPSLGLGCDVLLAVFDEEETGLLGARAMAAELPGQRRLAGVVVYECVGFYTGATGAQTLPPGSALIYPRQTRRMKRRDFRGDWTLLAYRNSARPLARTMADCLAYLAGADAVMLARDPVDLPMLGPLMKRYVPLVEHFARSDHRPFWERGVPAVQVTDTANFRNPNYHRPSDTAETLDYGRMADLVAATSATLLALTAS